MTRFIKITITLVAGFLAVLCFILTKVSDYLAAWGPSRSNNYDSYYAIVILLGIAIVPWIVTKKRITSLNKVEPGPNLSEPSDTFSVYVLNIINFLALPIFITLGYWLIDYSASYLFSSIQLFLFCFYLVVLYVWFRFCSNIIFDEAAKLKFIFPYICILVLLSLSTFLYGVLSFIEAKMSEVDIKAQIERNKVSFREYSEVVPILRKYINDKNYFLMSDFKSRFNNTLKYYYQDPDKYQQSLRIDSHPPSELNLTELFDVCRSDLGKEKGWCLDNKAEGQTKEKFSNLRIALSFIGSMIYFKGDKLYIDNPVIVISSNTGRFYFFLKDPTAMCFGPFISSETSDIHKTYLTNYILKKKYANIPCDSH
jgi:hypothetical protein